MSFFSFQYHQLLIQQINNFCNYVLPAFWRFWSRLMVHERISTSNMLQDHVGNALDHVVLRHKSRLKSPKSVLPIQDAVLVKGRFSKHSLKRDVWCLTNFLVLSCRLGFIIIIIIIIIIFIFLFYLFLLDFVQPQILGLFIGEKGLSQNLRHVACPEKVLGCDPLCVCI